MRGASAVPRARPRAGHTKTPPGITRRREHLFNRPTRNPDPCPAPDQPKPRSSNGKPWSLDRRLTSADRTAIVSEYQAGALQKTLAEKYGISLSSVKRLIRVAREVD